MDLCIFAECLVKNWTEKFKTHCTNVGKNVIDST